MYRYFTRMMKTAALGCVTVGTLWCVSSSLAWAEDVTLFRSGASADEIVNGFMGGSSQRSGHTRSIQINSNSKPPSEIGKSAASPATYQKPASTAGANVSSTGCPSGNSVAMNIQFEYNSADLTSEARNALSEVAKAMVNPALASCRFVVEGHTDAKGDYSYNMTLSQRRAHAVQKYLVSQGVGASRLKSQGKGPTSPINPNDPYADENRRVQFRTGG
ncbi:OmpA-OmpF porin, OOP family [Gammaproteobacteria bacterium]